MTFYDSDDLSRASSPLSALSRSPSPPPAKRRRISERKPRTTEYLDLTRSKLDGEDKVQLDRLVNVLHKRRKIVVVAGAGISVAAGSKTISSHPPAHLLIFRGSTRLSLIKWPVYNPPHRA